LIATHQADGPRDQHESGNCALRVHGELLPNADYGSLDFFSPDVTATVDAFLARMLKR
jgi:hypothetical protein